MLYCYLLDIHHYVFESHLAAANWFSLLLLLAKIRDWEPKWVTNSDIQSEEWTDAQWTDGMCANLQVVQIDSYFRSFPLSFMKLILYKASLLRTLSVDVCPVSQDDPLNELLKCRRASAQAQVLFKAGTKLGKNLGGAKQRQLARKEVQQISAPPTCTSTTKISDSGSTGLRLLASGRGAGAPLAPPLAPCLLLVLGAGCCEPLLIWWKKKTKGSATFHSL